MAFEKLKFKYDYRFQTATGFGEESLFYKVSDLEDDLYEDFLSYIPEHFWEDYLGFIFDSVVGIKSQYKRNWV